MEVHEASHSRADRQTDRQTLLKTSPRAAEAIAVYTPDGSVRLDARRRRVARLALIAHSILRTQSVAV